MKHANSAILPDDLLPLFVGITGHRDLRPQDVESLREVVRREFRELRTRYPNTPIVALSPLGEGADRLVACVALEEGCALIVPLPLPRAQYEASFADDASRAEFAELLECASETFTLPWIARGHEKDEAPAHHEAATPAQIEGQYAAMGAYLARYSHVLLALWDGDDAPQHERIGGTAHIVRLRLHGAPPPYGPVISPLERAGYGAVHHVLTPRQSRPLPTGAGTGEPFTFAIKPDGEAEDFECIDAFNADVQTMRPTLGERAHDNARALISAAQTSAPSPDDTPPDLSFPLAIYGWSDAMSSHFSRQVTRATRRVFLLVFFAALCFNLFHSLPHNSAHGDTSHAAAIVNPHSADSSHDASSHDVSSHDASASVAPAPALREIDVATPLGEVAPVGESAHPPAAGHALPAENGHSASNGHETSGAATDSHDVAAAVSTGATLSLAALWALLPWFLWFYLGLVGLNILLHGRTEKQELQTKYQDYRALAEGMRVQIFWRLAGLHEDVSDHYLGKQRGELNWIRHAIKSCNVLADARQKNVSANAPLPLVVQRWAREQRDYYVYKAHSEHRELERQEKYIRALVVASVALSLALGVLLSLPSLLPLPLLLPFKTAVEAPLTHALIMICIVMLAVTAGLLHGYNTLLARAEHTKRYGRMGTLFETACQELETQLAAGHSHKTSILLHELGREALAENGDWVMLHRERPLEVPHAG